MIPEHLYLIQHSINLFAFIFVWLWNRTWFWYITWLVWKMYNDLPHRNLRIDHMVHESVIFENFSDQTVSYLYPKYISKPFWHFTIISHQLMCKNNWKIESKLNDILNCVRGYEKAPILPITYCNAKSPIDDWYNIRSIGAPAALIFDRKRLCWHNLFGKHFISFPWRTWNHIRNKSQ